MKDSNSKERMRYKLQFLRGLGLIAVITIIALFIKGASNQRLSGESGPLKDTEQTAKELTVDINDTGTDFQPQSEDQLDNQATDKTIDIELPPPDVDEQKINSMINALDIEEYQKAEDKVAQSWPKLAGLREQLLKELRSQFELDSMTGEELIQHAVELREKFWQSGGRMSSYSYKDIYLSRVLLELGYKRFPTDLTLIDELVETIQSAWPKLTYSNTPTYRGAIPIDKNGNRIKEFMVFDKNTMKELFTLRQKQFDLVENQMQKGRTPEFKDLLRVYDLAELYRYMPGANREQNREQARELVKWLLDNANRGEWDYYQKNLERLNQSWAKGHGYGFNIFINSSKDEHPGQFGRRFPSFQGPRSRGLIAAKDVDGAYYSSPDQFE